MKSPTPGAHSQGVVIIVDPGALIGGQVGRIVFVAWVRLAWDRLRHGSACEFRGIQCGSYPDDSAATISTFRKVSSFNTHLCSIPIGSTTLQHNTPIRSFQSLLGHGPRSKQRRTAVLTDVYQLQNIDLTAIAATCTRDGSLRSLWARALNDPAIE